MEPRNDSPNYLRNEHDDLTEDLAQSLPVEEQQGGKNKQKDNPSDKDPKSPEWQRRLREELSAGREEKDFTD